MQAIETKYLGPTNHRGSRIKATAWAGSVTIPYDYGVPTEMAHWLAAAALQEKLGWDGKWLQGGNAKGDGYCFVRMGEGAPYGAHNKVGDADARLTAAAPDLLEALVYLLEQTIVQDERYDCVVTEGEAEAAAMARAAIAKAKGE